jgi:hypothetical protein
LLPKTPGLVKRDTPKINQPNVVKPTTVKPQVNQSRSEMAQNNTPAEGATPRQSPGAQSPKQGKEVQTVVNGDQNDRVARTTPDTSAEPNLNSVAAAQFSPSAPNKLAGARAGAAAVNIEEVPRMASGRSARPEGASRELTGDASLSTHSTGPDLNVTGSRALDSRALTPDSETATPRIAAPEGEARQILGAPALSQEGGNDATRASLGSPVKVEAEGSAHEGRLSGPETLVARAETRPVGEPTLSTPQLRKARASLNASRFCRRWMLNR